MHRRENERGSRFRTLTGLTAAAILLTGASPALAQSTLTLNQSKPKVVYATLRGGSYANANLGTILQTRASSSDEYKRRALLKFDTHNTLPKGTPINSAILTLTVKQASGDPDRRISVYQNTTSWAESEVTWRHRRVSQPWGTAGGDVGVKLDEKTVGPPGTRVSFDVTALVKRAVSGLLGSSRYTRVILMDNGSSTSESWRSYHTPDDPTAANRPTLKITYGGTSTSSSDESLSISSSISSSSTSATISGSALTLNQSRPTVVYATLRGGSYADRTLNTILQTRASSSAEYERRALLKFDTENTLSKGTPIASAILTVTVKQGSGDPTRRVSVYRNTTSWSDREVTWRRRRISQPWGTPGGDIGTKLDEETVGNATGTRVSFDITALVRQAVAGQFGSRYTRVILKDNGSSSNESWRAYYTPDDSNAANRPTLKITLGSSSGTSTQTAPGPEPAPEPEPAPAPTSGKTLRLLEYNVHHNGWGTDGVYSPSRVASVIAKVNPHVVALVEIEKYTSWSKNTNGVAVYKSLLEQKTGVKWYAWDAQNYGDWSSNGLRTLFLSKYPFVSTFRHEYSVGRDRSVGGVTINFNGRNLNLFVTHFDPYDSSNRLKQAKELVYYMSGFANDRIALGDFNDQPGDSPITTITSSYFDAWAEGKKKGIAYSPSDNPNGYTRRSRLDYVFYSRGERWLTLKRVAVVETRNSSGIMPSDHRPVLAEFAVQ